MLSPQKTNGGSSRSTTRTRMYENHKQAHLKVGHTGPSYRYEHERRRISRASVTHAYILLGGADMSFGQISHSYPTAVAPTTSQTPRYLPITPNPPPAGTPANPQGLMWRSVPDVSTTCKCRTLGISED